MTFAGWGLRLIVAVATLGAAASVLAQAAASQPATAESAYFPLVPGTTWKYLVTGEANEKPDRRYVQTLTVGAAVKVGNETAYPIDGLAYAARADGAYVVGRVRENGSVEALAEAQKVVPAKPRASEAWNATADGASTYSTCLGSQPIKSEAGDFTTQCVFSSTASGPDAATQRSTYRYFARGVGLVRETVSEKSKRPDGTLSTRETTRDLIAFTPVAAVEPTSAPAAKAQPLGTDALAGDLLDPTGQPIAQATVLLRRADGPDAVRLQTNLAGRFAAAGLDAGAAYVLAVNVAGYEPVELPLRSADGRPLRLEVRLKGNRASGADAAAPVDALIAEGKRLAASGDARGAMAKFSDAVAADPKSAVAHAYRAMALGSLRQLPEAQRESEEAIRLGPTDATNWQAAGQVRVAQGQTSQARGLFDKAAQLSPRRAGAIYTDLAAALASRNDAKLAGDVEAALKLAASADPPSYDALFQLGQGYANAGKAEGKSYLRRYLDATAKLPDAERDPQKVQLAKQMIRALDMVNAAKGK